MLLRLSTHHILVKERGCLAVISSSSCHTDFCNDPALFLQISVMMSVQSPRTSARRTLFWEPGESRCCSFQITVTHISLSSLRNFSLFLLHGSSGMEHSGHYKAGNLPMSGYMSSPALPVWRWRSNFHRNNSVEIEAIKPEHKLKKQSDLVFLCFHLKDIEYPHPQMP